MEWFYVHICLVILIHFYNLTEALNKKIAECSDSAIFFDERIIVPQHLQLEFYQFLLARFLEQLRG